MITSIFWIIPLASVLALAFAWFFFRQMMKESEGTELMKKIASFVREGAMSYLKQQYKSSRLGFRCPSNLILYYGLWLPCAKRMGPDRFLTGGFFSGLAGFLGMKTATYARPVRRTQPALPLNKGLLSRVFEAGRSWLSRCRTWIAGYLILVYPVKCFHPRRGFGPDP